MTALVRLVCLGFVRSPRGDRPLYMPEPDWSLILVSFGAAEDGLFDDVADALEASAFRRQLVVDQQRINDAIVSGYTRPFEGVEDLPPFAQIMRLGA